MIIFFFIEEEKVVHVATDKTAPVKQIFLNLGPIFGIFVNKFYFMIQIRSKICLENLQYFLFVILLNWFQLSAKHKYIFLHVCHVYCDNRTKKVLPKAKY